MTDAPPFHEQELFELRPRLTRFFSCRGQAWAADDLADDAILRVLEKIRGREPIDNLQAYTLGVAKFVLLEHLRRPIPDPLPDTAEPREREPEDSTLLDGLERCLARVDPQSLILRFYGQGQTDRKNKDVRKNLAAELGISVDALFVRASKLRRKLRECVERSLEPEVVSGQETSFSITSRRQP